MKRKRAVRRNGPHPSPSCHAVEGQSLQRSSLYRESLAEREEIQRHKWLESEKAGRDIGFDHARISWVVHHRARCQIVQQKGHSVDFPFPTAALRWRH